MYSKSFLATAAALLLTSATASAQSSTAAASPAGAASAGQSTVTASPTFTGANAASLVDALIPTASLTSLSPSQASQLEADALAYFSRYTASNPLSKLEQDAIVGQLFGGGNTSPTAEQESQIEAALNGFQTAALANPTAYAASVGSLIAPFGFAGQVSTYAGNLLQGLRTVVASDLSMPVPTPDSAQATGSHNAGAHKAVPTGAIGAAAAAVAFGAALL